jgi:class 3 adenylate cyclase
METLGAHHRIVSEAIAAHGGSVDHTEGDAFVAVFADAAAAVKAAVDAQRALGGYSWGDDAEVVRVRMGLHTGIVIAHTTGYLGLDARRGWRRPPMAARFRCRPARVAIGQLDDR